MKATRIVILAALAFGLLVLAGGKPAAAADKENCLMCHKYRFIGRIDENGKRINYNVDEHIFGRTVHRNVACRDCHTNITKLPHDPITEEVNCATQCHVKPPFADENFSHQKIIETYNNSVHGIKPDDSAELKQAKPYCKFCHLNPIYTKVDETRIAYEETLARCQNCHQKQGVTMAYKHITHRLRHKTSRSPQEVVKLCAKCHQDEQHMAVAKPTPASLEAVETYNHSVHGQSVTLGSDEAADCISCHASTALHDIYKKDNQMATTNPANLESTCKQCHVKANERFIEIAVHSKGAHDKEQPALYFTAIALKLALFGTIFGLMGLLSLETFARRRSGVKLQLRRGTTWREHSNR